ncbi:MarR family transcriptional regulator [Candidatus Woesearchaeota archaeon]|nr:MarR family transcriptional regulator [Candidatus Woesearchaeota archaeon]
MTMRNKHVGIIILVFSLTIGLLTYMFNRALTEIVSTSCSHGTSCPMWGTIKFQTNISIALMIFIMAIGSYMVITDWTDVKKKKTTIKTNGLSEEDKSVLNLIVEKDGSIFQSEIVESTGLSKVKVSRILDRLEGRNIISRLRRGMTNVVILKQD